MMQHFIQSYLGRVFVAEHNHPQRIADQDNVEAAFIEQTRGWIIIGGQRGDALAALLHFTKFFCRVHSCESWRVELRRKSPQASQKLRPPMQITICRSDGSS